MSNVDKLNGKIKFDMYMLLESLKLCKVDIFARKLLVSVVNKLFDGCILTIIFRKLYVLTFFYECMQWQLYVINSSERFLHFFATFQ